MQAGRSLWQYALSEALLASIASIASSMVLPMVGCLALSCREPAGLAWAPRRRFPPGTLPGLRRRPVVLQQRFALSLESVGDVFEEDQTEGNMLVIGRLHVAPELVGRGPELCFKPELRTAVGVLFRSLSRMPAPYR